MLVNKYKTMDSCPHTEAGACAFCYAALLNANSNLMDIRDDALTLLGGKYHTDGPKWATEYRKWKARAYPTRQTLDEKGKMTMETESNQDKRRARNIRRLKAYELRQSGLKWQEIGDLLGGVSRSRAAQLGAIGERLQNAIDAGRFEDPRRQTLDEKGQDSAATKAKPSCPVQQGWCYACEVTHPYSTELADHK